MFVSFLIFIFAIYLRLNNIEIAALGDESYSLYVAKNTLFSSIFTDAGNPPFYYLIIKLEHLLFNFDILGFKLTSVLFNFCSIIFLWILLKQKFNLKTANTSAFICAINLIMIYYSQEIRCYSLAMMLSPLLVYFLFETIQKRKNISFIFYGLLGIIAINTHYYECIFLFLNFIFATIYLKNKKEALVKFILANFLILLSFLPYFTMVAYKKALLDSSFNSFLDDLSFSLVLKQIKFIFGGLLSFVLSVYFLFDIYLSKKIKRKNKLWITYLAFIILGTIITSIVLSFLIRPIIAERYHCFLIPLFIAFLSIIFNCYNNKKLIILFIIWLISIQYNTKIKDTRTMYRIEQSIVNIAENNEHSYILTRSMTKFYFKTIGGFEKINILTISNKNKEKLQKDIQNKITDILNTDNKAVIYTVLLNPKTSRPKANYICYYDKISDLCVWKITKK